MSGDPRNAISGRGDNGPPVAPVPAAAVRPAGRAGGDAVVLPAGNCLSGGGNMGALMRSRDWSTTPLGPIDAWPQSLRTAVSIMLASGFPMLVLWGDEYIQLYNDAYRPVLGATKHPAALGQPARDCWPEIWEDVLRPMFDSVMAGGEPIWNEDLRFVLDRNAYLEETFFTFSYSAIRDETGRPGGVLVTCVETTDRVIGERRLRTLGDLGACSSGSQSVEDACAAAARILSANPNDIPVGLLYLTHGGAARLAAVSGVEAGAPIAPPALSLAGDESVWPVARVIRTGEAELVTGLDAGDLAVPGGPWPERSGAALVLPLAQGGQVPATGALVAAISPRLALDGRYRAFLELVAAQISTALTGARAYEAERQRAEALAEIDRVKTAFFNNVSHEFRTPLTLLLGPIDAALASPEGTLVGPDLLVVHRNAVRLLKLVNTLLDFSRIEAGRVQASYQHTDIAALTADLASTFRSLVERAGLRLDVDCGPIDGPVYVDREMWEKIVLNLLSNAFKFTFEGTIRVVLRQQGDAVVLTVSDSGVGIPGDELPRVFERFHRVRDSRSRSHEGTGIGLALVSELVRLHGGTITVSSAIGEGTAFTVTVPTGAAHLPPDRVEAARDTGTAIRASAFVDEAQQWLQEPAPVTTGAVDRGIRILVADDNADMRDYLTRLLRARWPVEAVADGAEALASIRAGPPSLVVSDVMMPRMDGFELLRQVRADSATARLPVILLSARAGEESRLEGLAAGADDYLVKPFSAKELLARVGTQVELSRLRTAAAQEYERLRTLFQLAPAAIAVLRGRDHVFELANDRFLEVVGRRDVVGTPGRQALPELGDQGVWELIDRVYESGETYVGQGFHVRLNRGSGGAAESAYFDFVLQPVPDLDGRREAILLHAVEVTQQVRAQREIEAARQAAESASRAKDEFLAMLGHELRNPLAPILTALQLMHLRGSDGASQERAVIDRQVRHLVRLVDDLLDVSRIARGKVELRRDPVELAEVVARAIEMASPLLEEGQHTLTVTVPRTGLLVTGDAMRLAQVVMNLLTNAAKYTPLRGRIHVRAARDGDQIELAVRDSGIGVAPELMPRVFDLFVQGSQESDRARGGLGLGLTIVRNLVQLHGGSVHARSAGLGHGSEFVIRLPARAAAGDRAAEEDAPRVRPAAARSLRVLVVDDNADAAQMIAEALSAIGHLPRVAFDAPSAIDAAAEFHPEVALLDLGLPVMDGYELAGHFLAQPVGTRPVLVAVTGYGQDSDRRRSRAAGFSAHVVKPVDLHVLGAILDRIAGGAAPADA